MTKKLENIYDIGHRGNLRGKAKVGFVRPTITQFFTSEDYTEVLKGYTDNVATSVYGVGTAYSNTTGSYPVSRIFTLFKNPLEWRSSSTDSQWVQFQFNDTKAISKISLSADDYYPEKVPTAFTFVASNTGAFTGEEVLLYTGNVASWVANETKEFTFANVVNYKYYRLNMTNKTESFGKTYEYAIGHLGMYEVVASSSEPLYSVKLNTGFTMTASAYTEGAYAVTRLIDSDVTTDWRNGPEDTAWIQFHFNEPSRIEQLVLCADEVTPERCPTTFSVVASNTGDFSGEEVALLVVNGAAAFTSYEGRYFNFSNPNTYSYYRLNMTGKAGSFGVSYEYIITEMYFNKRLN